MSKEKILIDESDIEERYEKGLYEDYLKEKINNLQQRIDMAIEIISKCKKLMPYEFDWDEQTDSILEILKGDNND